MEYIQFNYYLILIFDSIFINLNVGWLRNLSYQRLKCIRVKICGYCSRSIIDFLDVGNWNAAAGFGGKIIDSSNMASVNRIQIVM